MSDTATYLANYVNGALLMRTDRVLSALYSALPFYRHAALVMEVMATARQQHTGEESRVVTIEPYAGTNPYVLQMQEYLQQRLGEDLVDAVVHGSLGTYDEISYSDFDALVILKDEVFANRHRLVRVAMELHAARRIMYRMDPLQHHGWFVLVESDLQRLPVLYFPPELLAWSKTMLHAGGAGTKSGAAPTWIFSAPLFRLCRSLEGKISSPLPANLYALKNLLSEFMLLPALYVQARDKKGLYKKFSFDAARPDFTPSAWQAMDKVSAIRREWESLLKEGGLAMDSLHAGTGVPASFKAFLEPGLVSAMLQCVQEAKKK